jgi:kynurenine formamidase
MSHWEWLVNLEELLGKGEFQFFGVPLKFKGGSLICGRRSSTPG